MTTCSVPECERPVSSWGWCSGHYQRWKKTGDVQEGKPFREIRRGLSAEELFLLGLPDPLPPADSCWEWAGTRSHYGVVQQGGRNIYAHRMAWERAANSHIPAKMVVRHTCDNKFCVNPGHLVLGEQSDNVRDAVERRLNCRGERHGRSALTEVEVREIKRLLRDSNLSQTQIADRFPKITRSAVDGISSGRTWRWVVPADYPLPS